MLQLPDYFHYSTVESTNDEAKKQLNLSPFVMVTADSQSKGRGRNGKTWVGNAYENLFLSFGIRHQPNVQPTVPTALQAAGALLVFHTLTTLLPQTRLALKYPNDIYAQFQTKQYKLGGVLIENEYLGSSLHSSVIGIGLNVNQDSFPQSLEAVSLKILGYALKPLDIAMQLRAHAPQIFSEALTHPNITLKRWETTLDIRDKAILILTTQQPGIAQGLSNDGHLVVALPPFAGETIHMTNGDSISYDLF